MTSHLLFNAALVRWLIIQSWSHAPFRKCELYSQVFFKCHTTNDPHSNFECGFDR